MILLNNVTRNFNDIRAVSKISTSIAKGDIVGIVGKNGAGKTTLLRLIVGNLQPSYGTITFDGYNIYEERQKYKYIVSFASGDTGGLYLKMSVWDNITFFASMYRIPKDIVKVRAEALLKYFDLYEQKNSSISSLSMGMKLKLKLAIAVIQTPQLLVLDEITSGMDYIAARKTMELIQFLNKTCGTTVLLTTHKINEINSVATKLIVLDSGEVISEGKIEQYYLEYRDLICIKMIANKKDKEYIATLLNLRKDVKLFEIESGREEGLIYIKVYTIMCKQGTYETIRNLLPTVELRTAWSEDLDLESIIKLICKRS